MDARLAAVLGGATTPVWAQGANAWFDFQKNVGTGLPGLTDTHAQTIYADTLGGRYLTFPSGVIVRTDRGLQTVPTRTNLLLQSQTFDNASWSKNACTVTANAAAAPDGTTTMDKLVEDSANAEHRLSQTINKAASNIQYTLSCHAKAGERSRFELVAIVGSNGVFATFDASTGTVVNAAATFGSGFTAGSSSIRALADGTYLAQLVFTSDTSTTLVSRVQLYNGASTYQGDGASGIYIWQAQLEAAAFASQPIVTTTGSATVNGNQQVISNLGTQLANGVYGFFQAELRQTLPSSGSGARMLTFSDGDGNDVAVIESSGTGQLRWLVATGGVTEFGLVGKAAPVNAAVYTIAFSVSATYSRVEVVGETASVADTSTNHPPIDRLAFGGQGYNATANVFQNARKVALWYGAANATIWDQLAAKAVLAHPT